MQAPGKIAVRRARPGDAAPVLLLVRQLGYQPDERSYDEVFAQVVRHPEAAVFVATEGTRVVGYLALSHRPQARLGGRLATVDELVVDAQRRGDGIGSALLNTALDFARSIGCQRVQLNTRRSRESYQRGFYAAHGFTEVDSAVFRLNLKK
jgi:ribosomal protein S18 acetylase RimI-like enzyme